MTIVQYLDNGVHVEAHTIARVSVAAGAFNDSVITLDRPGPVIGVAITPDSSLAATVAPDTAVHVRANDNAQLFPGENEVSIFVRMSNNDASAAIIGAFIMIWIRDAKNV